MRYEYDCLACNKLYMRNVPVAERDNQVCLCGSSLNRIPAVPALQFKGTGWTEKGSK